MTIEVSRGFGRRICHGQDTTIVSAEEPPTDQTQTCPLASGPPWCASRDHAAFDKFVGIVGISDGGDGDDGAIIVIEPSSLHIGRKSNDGDGGQYIQQKRSRILQ